MHPLKMCAGPEHGELLHANHGFSPHRPHCYIPGGTHAEGGQASCRSREKRRALSLRSLELRDQDFQPHDPPQPDQQTAELSLKSTQTWANADRVTRAESPVLSEARRACVSRWEQQTQGPIGSHAFDFRHHAT